jgi:GAF domain-containing protein
MTREAAVVQGLVRLADTLVADYDVVEVLDHLTEQVVELLGVSAAGVMLASVDGQLRLVASSSETMRIVELFELQAQEGPCMDCYRTGERVEHEDLGVGTERWPRFARVAVAAGFRSAHALPLRLRGRTLGALNLFSTTVTPMHEDDVTVAQAFADLATISILQARAADDAKQLNEQLQGALQSRIAIEQAKGIIAERSQVSIDDAFELLRGYARANRRRLATVARELADGTLDASVFTAD